MGTLYRKVSVSERLPEKGEYLTDLGIRYLDGYKNWQLSEFSKKKKVNENHEEYFEEPDFWLEEIHDHTAQLKADKAELLELRSTIEEFRDKANQSADNLHKRGLQSSGMCSQAMETAYNLCLIEIESLIQKHKQ